MSFTKRVINKLHRIIFKNKLLINELKSQNEKLNFQLDYMKRHSDITKLSPAQGILREYQIKELEFAEEIIQMLNSKDIYPFFDGGCLIGALRHKGFVPWDDDIDLGVMRSEFDKIKEIAKNEYIWAEFDNTNKSLEMDDFVDDLLKNKKYVFIQTPFCIHCYSGNNFKDSVNVEFFPYDFVADGITDSDYINYTETVKKEVILERPWKEIFDFYDKELEKGTVLTKTKTSRIMPGLGNYAQTQYRFHGFYNYEDNFPISFTEFENHNIPVPNKPDIHLQNLYGDWCKYPSDVGISHSMESMNEYLTRIGCPYKKEDFLF